MTGDVLKLILLIRYKSDDVLKVDKTQRGERYTRLFSFGIKVLSYGGLPIIG
jgi:hypothetical protein